MARRPNTDSYFFHDISPVMLISDGTKIECCGVLPQAIATACGRMAFAIGRRA
jgi:hypothetical protein